MAYLRWYGQQNLEIKCLIDFLEQQQKKTTFKGLIIKGLTLSFIFNLQLFEDTAVHI